MSWFLTQEDRKERVSVHISSDDRASGTHENFMVALIEPLTRVHSVDVVSVEFPYSYYIIHESNGIIDIRLDNGTELQIVLTVGKYNTLTEFVSMLQTVFTNIGSPFVVEIVDNKAVIKNSFNNFSILAKSPSKSIFGIDSDSMLGPELTLQIDFTQEIYGPNNKLTVSFSDSETPIFIPPGNYSAVSLCKALELSLNSTGHTFKVTYNADTYKLTFTCTDGAPFKFVYDSSPIASIIGLTKGTTINSVTVTMQDVIKLNGPSCVFIKSNALLRPKTVRSYLESKQNYILCKIPMYSTPGSLIVEKNIYNSKITYGSRQRFQNIDFTVHDQHGRVLNLNGMPWSMTLIFELQ